MSLAAVLCAFGLVQLGVVVWVVAPRIEDQRQMRFVLNVSLGTSLALTALALVIHYA